jgi:ornithine decarboxylase
LCFQGEISKILDLGVEPERIIFANPVKMASHIKYAAHHGVDTMTFDNHTELSKIKAYHPNAK